MTNLPVNINGRILQEDQNGIHTSNRSYLYGDGVFETIRVFKGKVINFENHFHRLKEGSLAIYIDFPENFTVPFFLEKIEEILMKSELIEGARVRLSIDRVAGGTYTPEGNEASYTIDVHPLKTANYELNTKGLEVDVFTDIRKQKSKLSNYKTKNGLLYILAAIQAKQKGLQDMLITNGDMEIIESSNSNLFIVSNGVLYTPGLEYGCLAGTMRMQIRNLALANGVKVYESPILPQNLLSADEVFLTNATSGVVWVSGYRTKRYFNNTSRRLIALLNDYWEDVLNPEGENDLLSNV